MSTQQNQVSPYETARDTEEAKKTTMEQQPDTVASGTQEDTSTIPVKGTDYSQSTTVDLDKDSTNWKLVFAHQQWGQLVTCLIIIGGCGVAYFGFEPHIQQFDYTPVKTNDNINFPDKTSTIPAIWAVVPPLVAMVINIFVVEFYHLGQAHCYPTFKWQAAIHYLFGGFSGFFVVTFCQQIFALQAGELRPDFVAICQPQFINSTWVCTNPDTSSVEDARKTFFSGHASSASYGAVFSFLYVLVSLGSRFNRARKNNPSLQSVPNGNACVKQTVDALWLAWLLAWICFAIAVGVTRITDYRHRAVDVTAGLFMGSLFASIFFFKTYAYHDRTVWGLGSATVRAVSQAKEA